MGRLQSPVRLNISESKYSNSFSIVYQYFNRIIISNIGDANLNNEPSRKIKIDGN
jgi:hypothetical protein